LGIDHLRKKQSRKEIANTLGVSESSVGRWMNLLEFGKPALLPKVLSIDEFRGNTEYGKFQCILTDPVHKRIVDVLPTRYHSQIYEYLRAFPNRNQVQYFVMDMNREYLDIAKKLLPNAKIVIDRFHVVRYCTWALENVRKRVQMKLLPEQRKYFKRSRKLLLAHMHDLSAENKAAVERMLLMSRDLREAYLLKEKFYDFMESSNSLQAKERLRAFRTYAFVADLPEFTACLTMLKNWEPFILNAFDCPYSNGFTEGVNNKIKVLKRIAFGYRSFRNFRIRILCTTNV
jgi:transposase